MNLKITILFFLCLSSFTGFAQKEVLSLKMGNSTSQSKKKQGYNLLNSKTGDLIIVMIDQKSGVANLLDSDFKVKSTLTFEHPKYKNILDYKIIGNTYEILFSNNSKKKFAIVSINFDSKKTSQESFKFDFDDEVYLETIHYNNQLFLLTANRDNDFSIRKLEDKSFPILKTISLSNKRYNSILLNVENFGGLTPNLIKIDTRVPNALEQTACDNKLYQKDNLLYLTIEDTDSLQTVLYKINLESLTIDKTSYKYPKGEVGDFVRYNSFILDDNIFQLGSSKEEMKITVKSFEDEKLKEFYIEVDKAIDFKNSPIIQDGTTMIPFVNRRELEETSKFLRKILSGDIGITGYKDGNLYKCTIGGNKKPTGGGYTVGIGATGSSYTYNSTYYSFVGYSATKSTFFNTHLDSNFNYVPREENDNVFDKIKEYQKEIKFDTAVDIFVHKERVYVSSYDSWNKTLRIVEM